MTPNSDQTDDSDPRERGILSPKNRDYLLDPEGYSRQGAHYHRSNIRDQTTNAIRDCWLLAHHLPEKDLLRIVEELRVDESFHPLDPAPDDLSEGVPGHEGGRVLAAPGGLHRGVVSAISLIYRLYGDDEAMFERVVEQGVRDAIVRERSGMWEVTVEIESERIRGAEIENVIEKLESGKHADLNELEKDMVISRLAEQDSLDIDALRETAETDQKLREPRDEDEIVLDDGIEIVGYREE